MENKSDKNTTKSDAPDLSTTSPSGTPSAASSGASNAASGTTPGGAGAGSTTGSKPGSSSTSAGPTASNAGTTATNAASARPITSRPAFGDPTVDRLSLDPADSDDWVTRTKLWVEENPALAIIGAIGIGLLVGRIVTAAIPEPQPKTLTGKIEKRAKELSKQGRYYADDAGEVISKQLAIAAEALGEASHAVAKNAKHGFEEAKDFSETVAEAIGQAFSKKASTWLDKIS